MNQIRFSFPAALADIIQTPPSTDPGVCDCGSAFERGKSGWWLCINRRAARATPHNKIRIHSDQPLSLPCPACTGPMLLRFAKRRAARAHAYCICTSCNATSNAVKAALRVSEISPGLQATLSITQRLPARGACPVCNSQPLPHRPNARNWTCSACGNKWRAIPDNILESHTCTNCANGNFLIVRYGRGRRRFVFCPSCDFYVNAPEPKPVSTRRTTKKDRIHCPLAGCAKCGKSLYATKFALGPTVWKCLACGWYPWERNPATATEKSCPACGAQHPEARLVTRVGRKSGRLFYSCIRFPACRFYSRDGIHQGRWKPAGIPCPSCKSEHLGIIFVAGRAHYSCDECFHLERKIPRQVAEAQKRQAARAARPRNDFRARKAAFAGTQVPPKIKRKP